jgi:hypothetical protein
MAENVSITIRAFDKTKKGFGSATKGLKAVAGSVFSLRSSLILAAGAAGFGLLVKSSLNATDTLAKTASKIGTTTEALGALRYAADLTGVATNTMDMALQRFTRRTAEAAAGTGEAKGAIKELGINAQELNRMPLDQRMIVLADAFQGVTGESDKLRLAFKLFDSEGAALVNTLSQGSDGLKEMLGEAKLLGLTMSSSASKGVEDTVDSLTKLKSLFKGITNQTVAAFAPAIKTMVEQFTNFLQRSIEVKGGVEAFARSLAVNLITGVQAALSGIEKLTNGLIILYNEALKAKNNIKNLFGAGLKDVSQYNDDIKALKEQIEGVKNLTNTPVAVRLAATDKLMARLKSVIALRDEAADNGSQLIAPVSWADALNKDLEEIKTSLLDVSNIIPQAFIPALQSVSDIEVGFKSWSDSLPSMEENIQSLTKQGLNGLTDALTAGVTGAANFADAMKAMAKSVIDSLIKMLIQKYIVDAAFGAITGYFSQGVSSSTNFGPSNLSAPNAGPQPSGRAIGGSVQAGQSYMVGERGSEMFVPNQSGSIVPNNKMGSGSGITINQTINVTTGIQSTVRAEIVGLMPQIAQAAKGAVADARVRGGNFSKAMVGA